LVLSIEKLSKKLRSVPETEDANAAVALLLMLEGETAYILLVRRVQDAHDPWSGQIALPGGKREPSDKDLKKTVVRETMEETNINLLDNCQLVGVMSPFQSKRLPEMRVLPFVFLARRKPHIKLNKKELNEYHWTCLDVLARNRTIAKFSFGEVPAFIVGDAIVWGLTYRILESLLSCVENGHRS